MPVKINYLENGVGIEYISLGVITGAEIIEANKKIYNRENLLRLRYKIIDRTNCTEYRVTPEDIQVIAEQDKEAAKINSNVVIALISPTALQYAMSRMWQLYIEANATGISFKSALFKDRKSAEKWVKEQLKKNNKDNKKKN